MSSGKGLVLASGSPRRAELLRQAGYRFQVVCPETDETRQPEEDIERYVQRAAREKAAEVRMRTGSTGGVLAADTIVELGGELLLKPVTVADNRRMLSALSGRVHHVHTAYCLLHGDDLQEEGHTCTRVAFRKLHHMEIDVYCQSGEGMDKAGGYGIQGRAGAFVEWIEGSYSGVVGLPLSQISELLRSSGFFIYPE